MVTDTTSKAFIEHRDALYGYVLAQTRDPHVAEDVFQEVGLAIIREAARGVDVKDFLPWARTICRHRIADYYRKERRRRAERPMDDMSLLVDHAFDEHPIDPEECRRRVQVLQQCLESLGAKARGIIDARYLEQLGIRDIADRVGWQPNSVKVALAKARKALQGCMTRKLGADA